MEVFEAVRTVLAVREFQDKPVPPDATHRIVEDRQWATIGTALAPPSGTSPPGVQNRLH